MSTLSPLEKPVARGRTSEIYAWGDGKVLKLYHDWMQPRWIEEEAVITRAVHAAGLPVPWTGELVEVDGRTGIVFEKISGTTILRALMQRPTSLVPMFNELARLHVQLHAVSIPGLPSQRASLRFRLERAPHISEPQRSALLARLERLPDGDRACHGDFHPDNVILTDTGPVIIDWMDGKRGNPMADVARSCLLIKNGAPLDIEGPKRWMLEFARAAGYRTYHRRYVQLGRFDREQFERWLPVMAAARLDENIPGEQGWLMRMIERGLAKS